MTIATFEQFCRAMCERWGIIPPPLAPIDGLPPAFGIDHNDVSVGFLQASLEDDAHGVVLVDYGPLAGKHQVDVFRLLLQTNFLMAGAGSPAFSLNPSNDHVVWQMGFAVSDVDPVALCNSLERIIDAVHQWREGGFFPPEPHVPLPTAALDSVA